MDLNTSFGEFITKEYGLLRQILCNLDPCDLGNAKQVCRDWNQAVETLTDKNPILIITDMKQNTAPSVSNRKTILPDVVLHQPPVHTYEQEVRICRRCKASFISDNCQCSLYGPNTHFIVLRNGCDRPYEKSHSSCFYRFCENFMQLLLTTSEHIQVSVLTALPKDLSVKQSINEKINNLFVGDPKPVKCLLVLMKFRRSVSWFEVVLREMFERQKPPFAIGGGLSFEMECKINGDPNLKTCALAIIALRGDNVVAHSDVLQGVSEQAIKRFMEKLAERVGPLPEGWTRFAFVAQCVNRAEDRLERIELSAFKNAFPSVPIFGMQALGEFGIKNDEIDKYESCSAKKRRMELDFHHSGTSSFLILTLKKV